MNRVQLQPDSDVLDALKIGRVLSSRINDVMARVNSKRYQGYLELINRQVRGFGDHDPNDQYRERELAPTALKAYEIRNGAQLERGWFYRHTEYDFLGCAPDAIEANEVGYTAHIRSTEETYERAVADNMNKHYMRTAQASMAVTGFEFWIHLDYWEDRGLRQRRLYETLFTRNPLADELLHRMAWFYCQACQSHSRTA